jgi:hypothetical protein
MTGNLEDFSELKHKGDEERIKARRQQLVQCWILGDFLQADGFRNAIMGQLLILMKKADKQILLRFTHSELLNIFTNTAEGPAL